MPEDIKRAARRPARQPRGFTAAAALRAGITLTELMVAMVIMTVGVLGMVGAFKYFNVGIQSAKIRSLANNIAQERIEFLKNKSYYRVLVTTESASDPNFAVGEMIYDVAPNGEEVVNVGGINFNRRVYIRKVNEGSGGALEYLDWDEPDPGLKEIKVYVVWYERGEWRKLEVRNLRENPQRVNKDSLIKGRVQDTGLMPQEGVTVRAQESPSYYGVTDASGDYSFTIVAGTYTLLATKDYYFPSVLPSFGLPAGETAENKDFTLTEMSSGSISGYCFIADRLLISQVVGSSVTETGDNEWVEVYNPTTWTWTMATGLGTGANELVHFSYTETGEAKVTPDIDYRTTTIAPGSYFLFANTGTVTAVGVTRQADAVYDKDGNWETQDNVINSGIPSAAGSLALENKVSGLAYDKIGWNSNGNINAVKKSAPDYEYRPVGYYVGVYENVDGLVPDGAFVRSSYFHTHYSNWARCFDSQRNYYDFTVSSQPIIFPPNNSSVTEECRTGVTAEGALAFADDGLSAPAIAASYGYFKIPQVATGTWTVYMSSGVAFSSVAYCGGTANLFNVSAGTFLRLTTTTPYGYITGKVTNVNNVNLPGIKMFAAGSDQVATNNLGVYTLPVEAGVVTVKANYQSQSPSYVELAASDLTVGLGEVVQGVNFALYQGGRISGRVTTNGVDPLPGIPVIGIKDGVEQGSGISDGDGYFMISGTGVSTGTYVVQPQLEAGEASTPESVTLDLEAGVTADAGNFMVTGAFGYVTGSVSNGSGPITTGVLVYVTTSTLAAGAGPPDITLALRSGTGVYYAASSSALGNYTIAAKGGYTYNVYAWYTTWSGTTPTATRKQQLGVDVDPNETVTVDFSW